MTETLKTYYAPEGDSPHELDEHFYMDTITVDDVRGYRSTGLGYGLLFSVKTEDNIFQEPTDTGRPMHWIPDLEISEHHWLKCGELIPLHSTCPMCGKRLLDE
jgi:hypothetical protein